LIRLNFIFGADSMAEAPWQERRQPGKSGGPAARLKDCPEVTGAVLAYRPWAKFATHALEHFGRSTNSCTISEA
jgi:hypothetical protein